MEREEQLGWEKKNARWAGACAVLAALLPIGAVIYATSLLGKLPTGRDDVFLQRVDQHSSGYILSGGVLAGLGTMLMAPLFFYLFRAIKARRAAFPAVILVLVVAAPVLAAGVGVARQVVLSNTAHEFVKEKPGEKPLTEAQKQKLQKTEKADDYEKLVNKLGPTGVAKDKLQSGSVATVAYVGFVANFLLGTSIGLIALHGMRAGLFSRFIGVIGVIIGVLMVVPLLGGAPVVIQTFWFLAIGLLVLNRWPQGRGPAWETGEETPWPTAQDRRDALVADRKAEPEPEEDDEPAAQSVHHTREAARPRESATHPRSKKRKRKRR